MPAHEARLRGSELISEANAERPNISFNGPGLAPAR